MSTQYDGGIRMSGRQHRHGKVNYEPTNPSTKRPDEQRRGKAESNSRGKPR